MIREDLVAKRIAIDAYRDFVAYPGDKDPTTSEMLKGVMAVEEEHASRLSELLPDVRAR
jgi:bacterioferritin